MGVIDQAEAKATHAARRAARLLAAAILGLVGLAFLTAAAWSALAMYFASAPIASAVVGAVYLLGAALPLLLGRSRQQAAPKQSVDLDQIIGVFFESSQAVRSMRRGR